MAFRDWMLETFFPNIASQQESDEQRDTAMHNLENLKPKYEEQYGQYKKQVEELLRNNPQLDLTSYMDMLGEISSGLSDIGRNTEVGVGRYLRQGQEYTDSMLDEIMSSTGDYLSGYKKLARSEMPGMDIYRDQITSGLSGNINMLKSMGGLSQNSLVSLLQGNQSQMANLSLEAGRYKTQMQQNLADAYLTSGTARGDALNKAAGFSQNAAGIRTNLGQFSAGIAGQQAGIAGQQANMQNTMFQNNEMARWMANLNWSITQAQSMNPLAFAADLYGSQVGFYEGESDEAREERRANQQAMMDLFTTYMNTGQDALQTAALA
jgi:hypothetical protein